MTVIARAIGQSGRRYVIERLLQDKPGLLGPVYLAFAKNRPYVLKSVPEDSMTYHQDMFKDLRTSPYVRVADDAIQGQSMFAYRFFKDHLLSFAKKKDVPLPVMKQILRDSLRGIAAIHEKGIVHTDIKANNILLDWEEVDGNYTIGQVQVADVEDAAYVPEGSAITGLQVGNWMWRSPEAHAARNVYQPTDIFSFGICIYAMTKKIIFAIKEDSLFEIHNGEKFEIDKLAIVRERQISYFAHDWDSLIGLIEYMGDSNWAYAAKATAEGFGKGNPREPFLLWEGIEEDFKDLVGKMTNVDPKRRITAQDALSHIWWDDVEDE